MPDSSTAQKTNLECDCIDSLLFLERGNRIEKQKISKSDLNYSLVQTRSLRLASRLASLFNSLWVLSTKV